MKEQIRAKNQAEAEERDHPTWGAQNPRRSVRFLPTETFEERQEELLSRSAPPDIYSYPESLLLAGTRYPMWSGYDKHVKCGLEDN